MTRRERVRYEMLLRVRDFGKAHHDLFPESLSGHQALAAVTRAIDEIDAHTTARLTALRKTRRDQAARRAVIIDRMLTIARTSKRVVVPSGVTMGLHMPKQTSDVAVIAAARTFLAQAEAHHDQFVSLGLPATCLADLRGALEAFEGAMTDRRLGRAGVALAKAGVKAALAAGADAARTLDVVVRNASANDPAVIAAWERDLRLVEGLRTRRSDVQAEPVAPAAGTTDGPAPEPQAAGPGAVTEEEVNTLRRAS